MAGWHHWLDGYESEWIPGVGDGQGGLACCDSWGCKESDTTEWLNWKTLLMIYWKKSWFCYLHQKNIEFSLPGSYIISESLYLVKALVLGFIRVNLWASWLSALQVIYFCFLFLYKLCLIMTLFHITWLPYAGFVTWLLSFLFVFIVLFLLKTGQEIGRCLCYPFLYYVWGKLIKFFQSTLNSEQWNWIWLRDYTDTYINFFWLGLRQWQPTPVLLPGKSHGRRSLVGCSP